MTKCLIEYDLPLADIPEASAKEKNIRHGHPSTLNTIKETIRQIGATIALEERE